jgi:hypothetical protein
MTRRNRKAVGTPRYGVKAPVEHRMSPEVLRTLQEGSNLLKWSVERPYTYSFDESVGAVQHWLTYLALLVWCLTDAVFCLFLNKQSLFGYLLSRQAVEYVARALYFDAHPDQALRQIKAIPLAHYELLENFMGNVPKETMEAARAARDETLEKDPTLKVTRLYVGSMMSDAMGGKSSAYAALYREPSQVFHGEALGMSAIFRDNKIENLDVPADEINAVLADLARYICIVGIKQEERKFGEVVPEWIRIQRDAERLSLKYPDKPSLYD